MTKFKKGDPVRVTHAGHTWETTITHVRGNSYQFANWWSGGGKTVYHYKNGQYGMVIELISKRENSMENLQVGDIIINGNHECKVLAVLGDLIATSLISEHDSFDEWQTVKHYVKEGWTVKTEEDVLELTVAEVSKKFGKTVKIVDDK